MNSHRRFRRKYPYCGSVHTESHLLNPRPLIQQVSFDQFQLVFRIFGAQIPQRRDFLLIC